MTSTSASIRPDEAQLAALNARLAGVEAQELIAWAASEYPGKLAISCSFGGPSGMVLVDLAMQVDRSIAVIYADTDFLFPETHATQRAVEARYGIRALGFRSVLSPAAQARPGT